MGTDRWRGYRESVTQRLTEAGYAPAAVAALIEFDAEMFAMMRAMVKGELPAQLMAELGLGLDLAQFQVLTAISRIQCGTGSAGPREATIGLVAEELQVDPSRASRLVSDLIASGHLCRTVSQQDGRRAVLNLTDSAMAMFADFRNLKWTKAMQVFADWDEADIVNFARLFQRYNRSMRRLYPGAGPE